MKKATLWACMLGAGLLHIQSSFAAPLLTPHLSATQVAAPQANAWVEINVQTFEQNIQTLQQQLQDKSQICAVMKADAYGHGIELLMPSIIKLNVPCVGITSNAEAAMVRKSGYQGRLLRLRAATDQEIQNAASLNMEELLGNYEQAQRLSVWAKQQGLTLAYHLGLNAGGMARNGLELDSPIGKQQALRITKLANLKLVGIMTHYAVEDEKYVRERLIDLGAEVLLPVTQADANSSLLSPGLLDVTQVNDVPDEEYFGPLSCIYRYDHFDEALALANATRFGLSVGLVSPDRELFDRLLIEARAGIVNWNKPLTGASSAAPFGGVGASGNHRASAFYAADYCAWPMASLESQQVSLPEKLSPGIVL